VLSALYSVFREEAELCVFAENAELNGAFSAIKQYSRTSNYVPGFNA
jgi:hypothetical protein